MTAPPLRVLIAEDNEDLRDLAGHAVSAEPDLKCVGTAADVESVIASTAENKADVLVLDLELQGRSSIDLLRTVRRAGSKITIVVFSGHSHPEMIRHTLAAGADAYMPKSGDYELLLDAIRDKRAHRLTPGRRTRARRQVSLPETVALETPGGGQPQRIGIIRAFEIVLFVLEAHVESLADVRADARAVDQVLGLFVEFDVAVDLVFNADIGVVEVIAETPVDLEPVAERNRADDERREAIYRRIHIESRHHGARWLTEVDVVELECQKLVQAIAARTTCTRCRPHPRRRRRR